VGGNGQSIIDRVGFYFSGFYLTAPFGEFIGQANNKSSHHVKGFTIFLSQIIDFWSRKMSEPRRIQGASKAHPNQFCF